METFAQLLTHQNPGVRRISSQLCEDSCGFNLRSTLETRNYIELQIQYQEDFFLLLCFLSDGTFVEHFPLCLGPKGKGLIPLSQIDKVYQLLKQVSKRKILDQTTIF